VTVAPTITYIWYPSSNLHLTPKISVPSLWILGLQYVLINISFLFLLFLSLGLRWQKILVDFKFAGNNCETLTYKATKLQSHLAIAYSMLRDSWLKIPFYTIFSPKKKWSIQILVESWLFLDKKKCWYLLACRIKIKMKCKPVLVNIRPPIHTYWYVG
jgi:hypothetical protein